jgi:hypothetical protein
MKTTLLDTAAILGGQGSIGSKQFEVPNPAPGIGPPSGANGDLPMQIVSSEATVGAKEPATYPLTSPLNEPQSQYSVPVQKG